MENDMSPKKENEEKSYTKKQRYAARIALALILLILTALLINAFAGGDPGVTLALLFMLIVFPCIFYGIKVYTDYIRKKNGD